MATFDIKNFKIINQVLGVALAHYIEPDETTIANVKGAYFFNDVADQIAVGSVIICACKDGIVQVGVTANNNGSVTVTQMATTAAS